MTDPDPAGAASLRTRPPTNRSTLLRRARRGTTLPPTTMVLLDGSMSTDGKPTNLGSTLWCSSFTNCLNLVGTSQSSVYRCTASLRAASGTESSNG